MSRVLTPSALLRGGLLCFTVTSATTRPAHPQAAYTAANAQSSITPWTNGLFSVDFAEAKIGLNFVRPVILGCTGEACLSDQFNFSLHVSGAARKGQRNLVGNFDFVPGFDIGGGIAYVARRNTESQDVLFLRATYTTQQRDVIISNVATGTTTIDDESQRSFGATIGFNHGFSRTTVVGFALEGRRELSTSGVQVAQEFCTPGTSAAGFRVPVCSDRFVGPLPDLWTGQARIDLNLRLVNLGSTESSSRLSLITAGSVDFVETANMATNLAMGFAISLPKYPSQPVTTLLLGVRDTFEANNPAGIQQDSYFQDHFLIRLAFSVPFEVMVGNR